MFIFGHSLNHSALASIEPRRYGGVLVYTTRRSQVFACERLSITNIIRLDNLIIFGAP